MTSALPGCVAYDEVVRRTATVGRQDTSAMPATYGWRKTRQGATLRRRAVREHRPYELGHPRT